MSPPVSITVAGCDDATDTRRLVSPSTSQIRRDTSPSPHSPEGPPRTPGYDSYYRHALLNLERNRGAHGVSMNTCGRYGRVPPHQVLPRREVGEVDVNRAPSKDDPTPKQAAATHAANRKNGHRVYDAVNALTLWKRLDNPTAALSDGPRSPEIVFDEDAIELENRGRGIAQKALDISP